MPLHADQTRAAQEVGNSLRVAKGISLIPDATIAAATSIDDIITYLDTRETSHADQQPIVKRVQEALRAGKALSLFSDTDVQAATSIDSLIALTPNGDTATAAILYHE